MAKFQSSPAPKGRCCRIGPERVGDVLRVSILTGPEGPVLHERPLRGRECPRVSILTGPEGPVLRSMPHGSAGGGCRFQSSPAPKGRCCTKPG